MLKRGQITFFIVLGIVILVVIAFLFFVKGLYKIPEREKVILVPTQKDPVEKYVESCIIKTANDVRKIPRDCYVDFTLLKDGYFFYHDLNFVKEKD